MNTQPSVPAFITHANLKCKKYIHLCDEICVWFHLKVGNQFCSLYQVDWRNLMKQSVTVGVQLLWGGRYGCNNGRYGCTIVMSYIEINKAVSQWLLTFNLCVSVTWPLTCAFHIPCTHTPEIIDMHRGVCDNLWKHTRSPFNIQNTFSDMGRDIMERTLTLYHVIKNGLLIDTQVPWCILAGAYQRTSVLFGEWSILTRQSQHENPSENIDETCLCQQKVAKPRYPCGVKI